MTEKRVVITGLGALTPIGNDVPSFWDNLLAGKSGAGPITHFDAANFKTQIACELKNFDVAEYLDRREARRIDPFCHYALVVADQAMRDAGIDFAADNNTVDRARSGVIWATGLGGIQTLEDQIEGYVNSGGVPRFSPFYIPRLLGDSSSGLIAMRYNIHGVNFNTTSACASANAALISARDSILLGKADLMIVGGSEASITPSIVGGFNSLKALSTYNEDPQHASRPFDAARDGFVIGEGAGALIVEEYEHARRRGAPIYAELAGGGMSADAYHATSTHPEGLGALLSMEAALCDAHMAAQELDYVNAHATATAAGDISELLALARLLGEHLSDVNISSTKSMTGHLLGAAGAIESIVCVLAIRDSVAPPTTNLTTIDPNVPAGANLTPNHKQTRKIDVAMNNSFGFGGHNATTLFRRVPDA